MKRLPYFLFGLAAAALLLLSARFLLSVLEHSHESPKTQTLPANLNRSWEAFGGSWRQKDDFIENESEERGAKLMAGASWHDYVVEADVSLLGNYGEAGLLIRTSNEEEGVNAYQGYFGGIRNMDNVLQLGRSDFGFNAYASPSLPHPIEVGAWYHLRLVAVGCNIALSVTDPSGSMTAASAMDPKCIERGRIGLKSYNSSARWKNIHITPADSHLLATVAAGTTPVMVSLLSETPATAFTDSALDRYMGPIRRAAQKYHFNSDAKPISSFKNLDPSASIPATIHGVVTITSPSLYVQDSSGSIEIRPIPSGPPLHVGDEIEVTGKVAFKDYTFILQDATIKLLWANVPLSPFAVSVFEVAAGAHAGDLVELEAELLTRQPPRDGSDRMIFGDGDQNFVVISPPNAANDRLRVGSKVRLRGVVSHRGYFTDFQTPFALLLPAASSPQVIALPSFWSSSHIILVGVICIAFALALHVLILRIQRWRSRAVLEERERLALDMHDTLAQSFAGIGFQLQAIRSDTEPEHPSRKSIDTALAMVRSSHEEAKRSIASLRPAYNSERGLVPELCDLARRLADGRSLKVYEEIGGNPHTLSNVVGDTFFRIGQEAITNTLRHARASSILIRFTSDSNTISLLIQDDGCGFNKTMRTVGLGIHGMEKRAHDLGARLEIITSENNGTSVQVTLNQVTVNSITHHLETVLDFIAGD